MKYEAIRNYFADQGYDVLSGKGGFWLRKDNKTKFITLAKARNITGISPKFKRTQRAKVSCFGDYATIAAINGIKL